MSGGARGVVAIRDATRADAAAIAAIYNDAVEHTTAIWNEATVDAADREAWIASRQRAGYPVLVAVESGRSGEAGAGGAAGADDRASAGADEIVGYASCGPWRPHDGYRRTVEHSVYVRADRRGAGLGRALLEAVIHRARADGKHVMIAGIDAANTGSIALHEQLGFAEVGRMPQVGAKFGHWLDLVFLQLILDERSAPGA